MLSSQPYSNSPIKNAFIILLCCFMLFNTDSLFNDFPETLQTHRLIKFAGPKTRPINCSGTDNEHALMLMDHKF